MIIMINNNDNIHIHIHNVHISALNFQGNKGLGAVTPWCPWCI